jgi:hypothetical protein
VAHEQQNHRQQQREPERLAQQHDVVREYRRIDAYRDAGRNARSVPADLRPEHSSEDDDHRTERDVQELPNAHVNPGDPIDGAEERWIERRAKRRGMQVRERKQRRQAVAARERGGDVLVVAGIAPGPVVASEKGQVDQPYTDRPTGEEREGLSRNARDGRSS